MNEFLLRMHTVGEAPYIHTVPIHPYARTGAMAQFTILSEAQTGLKPTTLNMTEAGTIPLVGLTALVGGALVCMCVCFCVCVCVCVCVGTGGLSS